MARRGSQSELRLIKRCAELVPKEKIGDLPPLVRGIYVLFEQLGKDNFKVKYIGLATRNFKDRLPAHRRHKRKWTHFSVFEVWENIRDEEIEELEGLFRDIYRYDKSTLNYNKQHNYGKLQKVKCDIKEFKCFY